MKKIVSLILTCLAFMLLVSFAYAEGSVQANSILKCDKFKGDAHDNHEIDDQCNCSTIPNVPDTIYRGVRANKPLIAGGIPYCLTGAGDTKGTVVDCVDDSYTEYYPNGILTPISAVGVNTSKECWTAYPFCGNNKCNQCLATSDCDRGIAGAFPNNPFTDIKSHCFEVKYYEREKDCYYCRRIQGNAGTKVAIIVLGYDNPEQIAEQAVSSIYAIQPYTYLIDNGKLSFYSVHGEYDKMMKPVHYTDSEWAKKLIFIHTESVDEVLSYASSVCDNSFVIVIDRNYPFLPLFLGFQPTGYKVLFVPGPDGTTIAHEIGHVFNLEDEQLLPKKYDSGAANLDNTNPNKVCPKFDGYGLDQKKCIPIKSTFKVNGQSVIFDAEVSRSTEKPSIMACNGGMFNIASCIGLMMNPGGFGTDAASAQCKKWACSSPSLVVKQSKQKC